MTSLEWLCDVHDLKEIELLWELMLLHERLTSEAEPSPALAQMQVILDELWRRNQEEDRQHLAERWQEIKRKQAETLLKEQP